LNSKDRIYSCTQIPVIAVEFELTEVIFTSCALHCEPAVELAIVELTAVDVAAVALSCALGTGNK